MEGIQGGAYQEGTPRWKYIRTLNFQWRVKRVEEFLSAASLDGLAPVWTYSAHMRTAEYCATRKEARWRFSDIKMVLRV